MNVVFRLGQLGYLETIRGKGGGMRLARPPGNITIGRLIRQTEDDIGLVECFQRRGRSCTIAPACILRGVMREALDAFLAVLDGYTLADLIEPKRQLCRLLAIPAPLTKPHSGALPGKRQP
jgi:Rrf2 family nitric oxide-sensitive transcriptional repressor